MSTENNNSDKENNTSSNTSISFDVFKTFYSSNSDLDNAEYYQKFPSVNPGTIRSWKARAKKDLKTEPGETPQTPLEHSEENEKTKTLRKELIEVLKAKTRINDNLLAGLSDDAQLTLLKNASENQRTDPNIRLMTPSGSGQGKLGIEKYLKIDEKSFKEKGFGDIELTIPASVLFDPNKSKKLNEYTT